MLVNPGKDDLGDFLMPRHQWALGLRRNTPQEPLAADTKDGPGSISATPHEPPFLTAKELRTGEQVNRWTVWTARHGHPQLARKSQSLRPCEMPRQAVIGHCMDPSSSSTSLVSGFDSAFLTQFLRSLRSCTCTCARALVVINLRVYVYVRGGSLAIIVCI